MIVRIFVLLLVGSLLGCESKQTGGPPPDTATSGQMEFVADLELQPVIDSLVAGFNAEHPDAKVTVRYLPATEALDAMLQRTSRMTIVARPLTAGERSSLATQQVELFDFDIALNAIACISSDSSAIAFATLQDHALGTSTRYTQVLGSHLSSTEAALDSLFHADSATLKGRVLRFATVDSVIAYVKANTGSVGYVSSAWLKRIARDSALHVMDILMPDATLAGGLKPVMLHLAYVYQGKYPLVSRVMGYTMEPPNTLPRGFLAYAMSPNGQRVFLNHDLLPRTQIIRLVPPQ